jgi:hypothetical protein
MFYIKDISFERTEDIFSSILQDKEGTDSLVLVSDIGGYALVRNAKKLATRKPFIFIDGQLKYVWCISKSRDTVLREVEHYSAHSIIASSFAEYEPSEDIDGIVEIIKATPVPVRKDMSRIIRQALRNKKTANEVIRELLGATYNR